MGSNEVVRLIVSKAFISSSIILALIKIRDPVENRRTTIAVLPERVFHEVFNRLRRTLKEDKNIMKLRDTQPTLRLFSLYSIKWIREGRVCIHDWTIYLVHDREYCEILWVSEYGKEVLEEAFKSGRVKAIERFRKLLCSLTIEPSSESTDALHYCLELIFALYKLHGNKVSRDFLEVLSTFRRYYREDSRAKDDDVMKAYQLIKEEIKIWEKLRPC